MPVARPLPSYIFLLLTLFCFIFSSQSALAEEIVRSKGVTSYFHSGPGGSRTGSVYQNQDLKVLERKSDWVKVQMDVWVRKNTCLLYTSPSPRDGLLSRMPSSA